MKDEKIKEITEQLEKGVQQVFSGEEYQNYLSFMGKFYHYSAANTILIWLQKPDATLIAGYQTWQKKFNRQVKKGEHGIRIIAPCPHKFIKATEDQDGNVTEKEVQYVSYKAISVFDVSQTEGEEVPSICRELTGTVEDFTGLYRRLESISPVEISIEPIQGSANGFYSGLDRRIVVKEGLSEKQMLKTLIHEISHAMLHSKEGEEAEADRNTKEVQAESIAYTVCSALGIDSSDYSFGYVAGWSGGKEIKELQASIEVIRKTAAQILDGILTEQTK